ncbi:MAG: restriction endonuclease subunit S [Bacteroidetes bacterium]|nr:restriction endonuclease subunit S [Bacteroidota bacterium]
MTWKKVRLGDILTESRIPCEKPNPDRRITVRLKVLGVEKRGLENEIAGATKQFIRKASQFIYGKQNFHKGAFGIIPKELDGFESSADLPAFDVAENCLPEWIHYFFKQGNYYLQLAKIARGQATQRIHPEQIYDLEIPLPDIETQKEFLSNISDVEKRGDDLSNELFHQEDLLRQLRQAFLREAMQGKLVKQDRKEGNAKDLLEKIKAEKEKLGKKEKPLPPIKAEEIPFGIPESWAWCRLGKIVQHNSGKTLDSGRNSGKLRKYITTSNLYWGYFDLSNLKTMPMEDSELNKCTAIKGDLLVCEGGEAGRSAIWNSDESVCFQNHIHRVRPFENISSDFLYWHFCYLNLSGRINIYRKGMGISNISGKSLSSIPVPLPPYAEQKRIVKKLVELMKLCDGLQHSIQQSKTQNEKLLQQVLREALKEKEIETV